MKIEVVTTESGALKLLLDGVEVSSLRLDISGVAAGDQPPVVVDPVEPDPDPVEPDPNPAIPPVTGTTDPYELDDVALEDEPPYVPPVIVPPYTGDSLLLEQASTMQPGEWRNLAHLTTWPGKDEGRTFKSFQTVNFGGSSADGMGWTQPLVYHNGELMCILGRDSSLAVLMQMDARGVFQRHEDVWGGRPVGRRPFNRLAQDDTHLYFPPRDSKTVMGYFMRAPLDSPSAFERYGVSIGDDQMDSVGNFAATYVPEWGRFYAYTPGGKIWSWTHGETEWHRHGVMPRNAAGGVLSGYAGLLLWNPIKKELVIAGGQVFGANANTHHMVYRLTEPMGVPELLEDRRYPDGSLMPYRTSIEKLIVDPRDGSYLMLSDNVMYRSETAGGTYALHEDLTGFRPFGPWEAYCPYAVIPGTDVIAFTSHISGLVLHRLRS